MVHHPLNARAGLESVVNQIAQDEAFIKGFIDGLQGGPVGMNVRHDKNTHEYIRSARDRKSTCLNSSHRCISYAVFCLKKKRLSPVYLKIDSTYLTPAGTSIRNIGDADQPGVRIAVTRKSVKENVMRRSVKHAGLRGVT